MKEIKKKKIMYPSDVCGRETWATLASLNFALNLWWPINFFTFFICELSSYSNVFNDCFSSSFYSLVKLLQIKNKFVGIYVYNNNNNNNLRKKQVLTFLLSWSRIILHILKIWNHKYKIQTQTTYFCDGTTNSDFKCKHCFWVLVISL